MAVIGAERARLPRIGNEQRCHSSENYFFDQGLVGHTTCSFRMYVGISAFRLFAIRPGGFGPM